MVTGPGMPPPPSVMQLEIIYLSRWGWNQSAAGRAFSLNEFRLFLWSFNEFIRSRRWAARKPEHGGEMRAVTVFPCTRTSRISEQLSRQR